MLGLGSGGSILLLSRGSGGSRLGSLLLLGGGSRLGLLRGGVGEGGGLEELKLGGGSSPDGLVDDGFIPSSGVGVLLAPILVEEELEATGDDAGGKQISQGDALADEVGVVEKVLLNGGENLEGGLLGIINRLLVVASTAQKREVPGAQGREDLGVEEGHPPQDGSITEQSC